MRVRLNALLVFGLLALAQPGCARPSQSPAKTVEPVPPPALLPQPQDAQPSRNSGQAPGPARTQSTTTGLEGHVGEPARTEPARAPPSTVPPPTRSADAAMHGRSLPKLELKTVGLHVGGGPNDLTTQRAFTGAIALQFQAFQACYRYVSAPKQQAIFGVDLLMPPESGRAQVKAVRTSLRGDPFVVCMRQAFEEIRFRNPLKRPTMVSYSVRFTLVGLNAETPSRP